MKIIRLLIIAIAFLIMVSSALTLNSTTDRTPVYINVAAMIGLIAIITILNLQKNNQNNK